MALIEKLTHLNNVYKGSNALFSKSTLSFPAYTDAPRMIMFNQHIAQRVVLDKPQKPFIFTNFEDAIGDRGSYNRVSKHRYTVTRIIKKFRDIDSSVQPYLMFVYDEDNKMYDVFDRKQVENLPEKYGFSYDNTFIDSLKEGDVINPGDTLSTPTCYDDFGNYGYGINVPFLLQINSHNFEDSLQVTKSLAKRCTSTEVDVVTVAINDNVMLLNTLGDSNEYKAFPNIGEPVKDNKLCVCRTIARTRLPYDFKEPNTRAIHDNDKMYRVNGTVVDIDIYCNKPREEIPETIYNKQLLRYLDMIDDYRREVCDYIRELIRDGCIVSDAIKIYYRRFSEQLDKDFKIKDDNNSAFSNIKMFFTVDRHPGLTRGQKLSGRYGNKGVISSIIEDHEAFYLENGTRIDITFDGLGIGNRLITFHLYEQALTFRAQRILERIRETKAIKDKEDLLFGFLKIVSPEEAVGVENGYRESCKTAAQKREYFGYVEEYGIYVYVPAFWRDEPLYDVIMKCDEKFPWIEPYKVYFYDEVSKRWVLQMTRQHCGYMYLIKMKQTSKKGLSARSTGSISKKGLPEKSDEARKFYSPYSKIPVRLGIQERGVLGISMPPEIVAKESIAHRTSPVARRALAKAQLTTSGGVQEFEITKDMTNRTVEVLDAYLLLMGYQMVFGEDRLDFSPGDDVKVHFYRNKTIFATTEEMKQIVARDIVKERCDEEAGTAPIFIGLEQDRDAFLDELSQKISKNVEMYLR